LKIQNLKNRNKTLSKKMMDAADLVSAAPVFS